MIINKIMDSQPKDENEQRQKEVCIGCNQPKSLGLVVCWACFKSGKVPFKYFTGSLSKWLEVKA